MNDYNIRVLKMVASNCALEKVQREMLQDVIKEEEKYRWHNLRKNPVDFPPIEVEVDVVCERKYRDGSSYRVRTHGFYEDGTILENDSDWNWEDISGEWCEEEDCYYVPEGWWEYKHYNQDDVYNNIIDDCVIAWRYIEQFEE